MTDITNADDLIDSRDVVEAIEALRTDRDAGDEYDADLLASLEAFAEEGQGFADWEYGETFIRDSYFTDYAQELAEDIGAISSDSAWPLYCIDWERAARELRMDYSAVEFGGVTYWARS